PPAWGGMHALRGGVSHLVERFGGRKTRCNGLSPDPGGPVLRAPAADVPLLPFGLADAKLEAPVARRGVTSRPALVNRLRAAGSATVATIVAPGAYGKTTLL